jgi:LEA14-like dessication related protein
VRAPRLLVVLAAVLLAGCATGLRPPEPPGVALESLRMVEAGLLSQRFELRLRLTNPNAVALPVTGLVYTLAISEVEIGDGVARPEASIPAYGETVVDLSLTTRTLGIVDLVRTWERETPETVPYRIEGRLDPGGFRLPVSFERRGEVDLRLR